MSTENLLSFNSFLHQSDPVPTVDKPLACVVLAAGKGTRMKSDLPKVMHEIAGRPMIGWVLNAVEALNPEKIIVVTGPDMDDLQAAIAPHDFVVQTDRLGTGHAVKTALGKLTDFNGDVLIILGDMPFITPHTLAQLCAMEGDVKILGTHLDNPTGYGRLIMRDNSANADGAVLEKIVEQADGTPEELQHNLVNTGAFCVRADLLHKYVAQIDNQNAQGEYYITDLPVIAAKDDVVTHVSLCHNPQEVIGVNSRKHLAELEAIMQDYLRDQAMDNGVTLRDPSSVYFAYDTALGRDVVIGQHVVFGPGVCVGHDVNIHPFCHLEQAKIGNQANIGPYARLRPGTVLGEKVRIGNFVELKNANLGKGAKANHLSYIGDAILGQNVNFSAGAITANYDGVNKFKTSVGDDVMVGTNVTLVAPIEIGRGAYIAAGSAITENVPEDALSVARNRPIIRDQWAAKRRKKIQDSKK